MAYLLKEYLIKLDQEKENRQAIRFAEANREINGEPKYYEQLSIKLEQHPISGRTLSRSLVAKLSPTD